MINKVNMGLWVEALLSGEFTQSTGALARIHADGKRSYCCLGVACEVALRNGVPLEVTVEECTDGVYYDNRGDALPARVVAWLGLEEHNHDPLVDEGIGAITANDGPDHWSFEQIGHALKARYLREEEPVTDGNPAATD